MTESRVENLLHQMSLKEPSAELNTVISSIVEQSEQAEQTEQAGELHGGRRLPWSFVSAVAAVCLLIGVVVGRATVPSVVAGETVVVDRSADNSRTTEASDVRAVVEDRGHDQQPAVLDGPSVAILCSMQTRTAPGSEEKRCTKCHSGVTDESVVTADLESVHRFHRQLCARCHDMSGALEHWQLPEGNDVMPNEPWHQAAGKDGPTG